MNLLVKFILASTATMAMLIPLGCSDTARPASEQSPDLLCYETAEDTGCENGAKLAFSSPIGIKDGYGFSSAEDLEIPVWINIGMECCPEASSVEFSALDDGILLSWNGSSPSRNVSIPYEEIESIQGGDARLVTTVRTESPQKFDAADPERMRAMLQEAENEALRAFEEGLEVRTVFEDGSESCFVYSLSPTEEYLQAKAKNSLQEFEGARFEIRKFDPSA